ncbi:MAG: shikimate dehydrogenase [Ignisphaera sp.]|uniref:Shikimate dehydrogenase (NADP(+)) n=1 Tax=Ignisphaera aggregans TaxID=334771 RepID=A0A7C4NJN8_9CREN
MDWVNSSTKLFGVVGSNISYTLSPAIHNYVFRRFSYNAIYLVFDIPENRFQKIFPALIDLCEGLNITIPYKEKALDYLYDCDPVAKAIGAVNTVHRGKGYNTDYVAIKSLVEKNTGKLEGNVCYIYGAGGVARATAFALGELGCRIVVVNRSRNRAEKLVKDLAVYGIEASIGATCSGRAGVVVNATPNPSVVPDSCLNTELVVELVYKPVETDLVVKAKKAGVRVVNGLKVLVEQALEAQRIWLGFDVPSEEVIGYLYARKFVW